MSKYNTLWKYIQKQTESPYVMTFDEIGEVAGVPLDHSFLSYKKELEVFGWRIVKISMKQQNIRFEKVGD